MVFDLRTFPWRRPLEPNWQAKLAELQVRLKTPFDHAAGYEISVAARALANQRLGALEQIKINRLAERLWSLRAQLGALRPFRVAVLSNRTANFLAADLKGAGLARGLLLDVVESEFDTVAAVAMGSMTLETKGPLDAVVLLLDEGAFSHEPPLLDDAGERESIVAATRHLANLVSGLRERLRAPVVVATVPLAPERALGSFDGVTAGSKLRFVRGLNDAITAGAAAGDWLIWDMAALAGEIGTNAWFDPVRFHQGKVAFAVELAAIAADRLCRTLAAMAGKSGRVLVLDLDNTIWGGVVGDDGVEGIRIGQGSAEAEAFLAVQRLALDLRERGVVLAVCSKNDVTIAQAPFRDHPDMLLRLEHIAVFQANWSDKASNLKAIAEALNLSVESLVFVDDNPAERERVRQELPLVTVLELDEDMALLPRIVVASGAFEHLALNVEDMQRAAGYGANAARAELKDKIGNYEGYLQSLAMRMRIEPFDRLGRGRIAQLINKSNQFNLTTKRYNEVDVAALESDQSAIAWQVRLTDSFADQGMIGVVILRTAADAAWDIDTWLMSCRVLERGVEQTLMNELVELARRSKIRRLTGSYIKTARNGLVADFYDRMQFRRLSGDGERQAYELDVDAYTPFVTYIAVEIRAASEAS